MFRFTTTATTRSLGRLAAVVVWTMVMLSPAAAQGTGPATAPALMQQQAPAPAQEEDAGVDWKAGWSYGLRGTITVLDEASLEPGFGFSGFAVLPLFSDFELEAEIGYQAMTTVTGALPAGSLSMFPVRGSLRVQLWRFAGAKPYANLGAGAYFSRFSIDQSVLDDLATVGFVASANIEPGIAFHGGAGVEWQRDALHFGVDLKYVFGSTDATSTIVDQVTQQVFRETSSLSYDGFWIALGARYSF